MRRLAALVGVIAMFVLTARPADAATLSFELTGIEISPGTTAKNCGGHTYTTNDITFAGTASGNGVGTWVASINVIGQLDDSCEPVRCSSQSPVEVVGGTWLLQTLFGAVGGPVTGGSLLFRPDGPVIGHCLGPVPATLSVDVNLAIGRFRGVHNAEMNDTSLDHRFFPPRVNTDLTLLP